MKAFKVKIKNGNRIFDIMLRGESQKDVEDYMEFEGIPNGDLEGHEVLSGKFEVVRTAGA